MAPRKSTPKGLTVAITGPTGEMGRAVVSALERSREVAAIIGMARRPFDPRTHGWKKVAYRRGDVLDRRAVAETIGRLGFLPAQAQWIAAFREPVIMSTAKARRELGWRPKHDALHTLRETITATRMDSLIR